MKLLCILAVVCVAAASPHNHGQRSGRRGGHSRERHPLRNAYRQCMKTEMKWPELRDKNCTEFMTAINEKLTKLFSTDVTDARSFFEEKYDRIRDAMEDEDADFPCDRIVCFKREMMKMVLSNGMPSICDNREEEDDDMHGFVALITSDDKDEAVEDMIDLFCYKTEKLSYKIHMKIVAEQVNMPGQEHGGKPFHMMRRMRKHCRRYDHEEGTCTGYLDFTDYVNDMFQGTWDVSLKKEQISSHGLRGRPRRNRYCAAKACFESAFAGKLNQEIKMPEVCHGLWTNRTSIFQESGFTDRKMKLVSCMSGFKLFFEKKLNDPSLKCDGTATQYMEDLYSGDAVKINTTLTTIVQKWREMAENAPEEPPKQIPDQVFCKVKAMETKLTEAGKLPSFCDEEEGFDQDIGTASLGDIKQLFCFKLEKFADHMDLLESDSEDED